jgi:hypothetical protein
MEIGKNSGAYRSWLGRPTRARCTYYEQIRREANALCRGKDRESVKENI